MANFTAKLDLHKEAHMTKNVADNDASAHVEAAKRGILVCKDHPGMWISKPGMILGVTTRDCPLCLQGNNVNLGSSSTESSNHGTAHYSSNPPTASPGQVSSPSGKGGDNKLSSSSSVASNLSTGQKHFDNGTYTGQLVDGKACGRGILTFANGNRYDGEFKDDKMNGRGVYTFADGD
eukprot:gene29781-39506_t